MRKFIFTFITLFFSQLVSFSDEMKFDNETYTLKFSALAPQTQGYGNEYFKKDEDVSNWTKMIGVYYYPNEKSPLEFAKNFDNTIENTDNSILLKIVENKKNDKAVLSFLVNGSENSKNFFEYDVYKFEKHPQNGMIVSKYASKHFFKNNDEISKIAQDIKENNDKYLELLIVSQTPAVLEKDIGLKKQNTNN